GVVLSCNGFDIIDLGVMVPTAQILKAAREHEVDIIGLSGLITPSLHEMVHVAGEMERQGLDLPLLIGGATTSKAHTALKVEPAYSQGPVVHVLDASRAAGVVSRLVSESKRDAFVAEVRADLERVRTRRQQRAQTRLVPLLTAQQRAVPLSDTRVPAPNQPGITELSDVPLGDLVDTIDWGPFFTSWQLNAPFPGILAHPQMGEQARKLFDDAQAMLAKIIDEKWLTASAVVGLFPAARTGDDVEIFGLDDAGQPTDGQQAMLHFLRQQRDKAKTRCLADFIAPRDGEQVDWLGAFVVTVGHGVAERAAAFEADHNDYDAILLKALADRLAEAFAERLHQRVRREFWGYAPDEQLDNDGLIAMKYQGIRPAPGYPACPDHSEKQTLWRLLDAERRTGVSLTESCAMWPAASVSGWYFGHPDSHYFGLGPIDASQVSDYARRKGMSITEAKRWLAAHL
ncbi:MAG: cobalamin-dependent protein, partial [Myxococcales bacterium]|nr:cobalamin-dependent protein [Myxococcales bacterium]